MVPQPSQFFLLQMLIFEMDHRSRLCFHARKIFVSLHPRNHVLSMSSNRLSMSIGIRQVADSNSPHAWLQTTPHAPTLPADQLDPNSWRPWPSAPALSFSSWNHPLAVPWIGGTQARLVNRGPNMAHQASVAQTNISHMISYDDHMML